MSKSHEIIDPSLYVMIKKASNQNILSIENEKVKKINFIIIISIMAAIGLSFIYYSKQKRKKDDEIN